jgi:hypothetical protein
VFCLLELDANSCWPRWLISLLDFFDKCQPVLESISWISDVHPVKVSEYFYSTCRLGSDDEISITIRSFHSSFRQEPF